MIALTARLNERDEQIVSLQEELEAYDRAQRKLEDQLDSKSAELIALRKAAMEHNAKSPCRIDNWPAHLAHGEMMRPKTFTKMGAFTAESILMAVMLCLLMSTLCSCRRGLLDTSKNFRVWTLKATTSAEHSRKHFLGSGRYTGMRSHPR